MPAAHNGQPTRNRPLRLRLQRESRLQSHHSISSAYRPISHPALLVRHFGMKNDHTWRETKLAFEVLLHSYREAAECERRDPALAGSRYIFPAVHWPLLAATPHQ